MEKDKVITAYCYGVAVVLCVVAFFFDKPFNVFVTLLALVCMFRVIAVAVLQKLSWKTLLHRLTLTSFIAAELSAFYGCDVFLYFFGGLTCIGGAIILLNAMIFINSLSGDENIDAA